MFGSAFEFFRCLPIPLSIHHGLFRGPGIGGQNGYYASGVNDVLNAGYFAGLCIVERFEFFTKGRRPRYHAIEHALAPGIYTKQRLAGKYIVVIDIFNTFPDDLKIFGVFSA